MKITEGEGTLFGERMIIINVDPGPTVLCDLCNENYTDSKEEGGFLFSSKAVCPKCAPEFMKSVRKYHEENFIKAKAEKGESFRDFIYRMRKEGR